MRDPSSRHAFVPFAEIFQRHLKNHISLAECQAVLYKRVLAQTSVRARGRPYASSWERSCTNGKCGLVDTQNQDPWERNCTEEKCVSVDTQSNNIKPETLSQNNDLIH